MYTEIPLLKIGNIRLSLGDMKNTINYKKGEIHVEGAHIHNCCEIYVNISGDVSFLVESTLYPLKKGDIIITMPNEMHHCVYNSDGIHSCFCMWFDISELPKDVVSLFTGRQRGHNNFISMTPSDKEKLMSYFQNLYYNYENDNSDSSSFLSSLYSVFDLMNHYRDVLINPDVSPLFGNILTYIDENIQSNFSAKDVAKTFYISRSSLYRIFSENLGITPARYIEDKRLSLAKSLITQKLPLKEVCSSCGFNDYSHFICVFRKKFAITPYKYMKSIL